MLSINISELIWTVINFFLLLFLLKRFLFDPICSFMDQRQARIDAGFEAERRAGEELRANEERLDAEKAESRLEAGRILNQAGEEDREHSARNLEQAKDEAGQARLEAAERLNAQREQEEAALQEKEPELASLLASRLLGESK